MSIHSNTTGCKHKTLVTTSRNIDPNALSNVADLDEQCRKADLERVFMKYGPLKEIWLASYAPFYAFVVYRNRIDAQVEGGGRHRYNITLKFHICIRR